MADKRKNDGKPKSTTGQLPSSVGSKADQARMRRRIVAVASVTPVGRAAKVGSKVVGKAVENKIAKTATGRIAAKKVAQPKSNVKIVSTKIERERAATKKAVATRTRREAIAKRAEKRRLVDDKKRPIAERGKRVTPAQNKRRAQDIVFNRAEKAMDRGNEMRYTGTVGGPNAPVRGIKGKNARKLNTLYKIAGY